MNDKQSTYDSMMQRVAEYDDEDAFKYIFDDLYAPLCLYARRMVPPGAAEDIAQEVFVALWENRNDIIIETSLKGWLLTGTRNRCLNYIKRQAVRNRYNRMPQPISTLKCGPTTCSALANWNNGSNKRLPICAKSGAWLS